MTMENNGPPGDQTNEPSGPTGPGASSPAQEPTFDVDGRPMTASQLVETAKRYKGLEPEFTRRSQRLAELEAVLGEYGQETAPGPGPEAPVNYGNPPVDYRYRPAYTPPVAPPYRPGYPQEDLQEQRDPIQERLDLMEANMEAVSFAQRNRWINDDQMRQVLAVRDRMESYYGTVIPLDSAKDRWLVESSEREAAAKAAADIQRQEEERASTQFQEAQKAQAAAGQQAPAVLPGEGGQAAPPERIPTTWEEIEDQFIPAARELSREEGVPQ